VTILTAVDREAIERHDFPVGRRGYDQAAVDEHLRRVADEIEALRGSPGNRPPVTPISAGTSEQVRAILEAAETGAAELRADAGRQAGEHVARVEEAADGMLAKLDELESQLTALLDALRRSSEQLTEGLSELHEQVSEFGGAAPEASEPAPAPAPEAATAVPEPPADGAALNGDEAGARLIALNMALSGTPREETARYLAEHYALTDPDALLDDVYAQVGP
jgi:DivIVA domain-containing protein